MAAEDLGNRDMLEETLQALQVAYECLPPEHPWGYFHYLDGPPAAGGGTGCFAWCENRVALLSFIAHYQAWIGAPEASMAPAERAGQVQSTIARAQAGEIDMEQARLRINGLLRGFSQIEWWGRADELLSGDSDFARELRKWYRDFNRILPGNAAPVVAAEAQDFFHALQEYGT